MLVAIFYVLRGASRLHQIDTILSLEREVGSKCWVGIFLVFWEIGAIFEKYKWQAKLKTNNAKNNSGFQLGWVF
jgi:hypothetical protein